MFTRALTTLALAFCASMINNVDASEYRLTAATILQECDITGKEIAPQLCPAGARFRVVGDADKDTHIIYFIDWYSKAELSGSKTTEGASLDPARRVKAETFNYKTAADGTITQRYFRMTKGQLAEHAEEFHSWWNPTYGPVVLPFKYRPQNGLFTKDLSLGGVGGIRMGRGRHTVAGLIGVTLSANTVDSASTEGTILEKTERTSLTFPIGAVYQFEKLQIGLFAGWDLLFDGNAENWIYQGKPWLSLGISIGLFTEEKDAPSDAKQSN